MAARGGPPDPTAEEKLPHPIIQSVPKLHKTIRHPGKARLPRLYWTPPPCGGTEASKTPTPEPGPSACTNPCSRRHTNQDPSPPGPAVTPTRRQSAPRSPNPPPDQSRNSAAARLATYVRRHRQYWLILRLFLFFQFMRTVFLAMHRAVKAMFLNRQQAE